MKKCCNSCGLVVCALVTSLWVLASKALAVEPDPLTRSVQSALHARGFYYGSVTGRPDPGTVEALRRFQIRQGLPVSGSPDQATLRALGLSSGAADTTPPAAPPAPTSAPPSSPPPPPPPTSSPSPPQDADRELLRREGLTQPASPPAARRPVPTPRPRKASSPSPATSPASPAATPKPRTVAAAPSPAPAQAPKPTPPPPAVKPDQERRSEPSSSASPAPAVGTFIRRYLARGAANDTDAELACFSDPVQYYDSGRIKRIFIRRDIETYHRRWPDRHFELEGEPVLTRIASDGEVTVRFRLAYRLQSPHEHANGRTDNEMRLRPGGPEGYEIVSVRERKL